MAFPDERHRYDRAIAGFDEGLADRARIGTNGDVGYLHRLALYGKLAENALVTPAQWRPERQFDQSRLEVAGGAQVELRGGLVVLEDRAAVGADQVVGSGDDRVED